MYNYYDNNNVSMVFSSFLLMGRTGRFKEQQRSREAKEQVFVASLTYVVRDNKVREEIVICKEEVHVTDGIMNFVYSLIFGREKFVIIMLPQQPIRWQLISRSNAEAVIKLYILNTGAAVAAVDAAAVAAVAAVAAYD
ncbi:hypothetical protein GQX74_007195 [Glossina fuscipes]|nr:hypothetical protein GQX74_007195 [Glossina fuscipes]